MTDDRVPDTELSGLRVAGDDTHAPAEQVRGGAGRVDRRPSRRRRRGVPPRRTPPRPPGRRSSPGAARRPVAVPPPRARPRRGRRVRGGPGAAAPTRGSSCAPRQDERSSGSTRVGAAAWTPSRTARASRQHVGAGDRHVGVEVDAREDRRGALPTWTARAFDGSGISITRTPPKRRATSAVSSVQPLQTTTTSSRPGPARLEQAAQVPSDHAAPRRARGSRRWRPATPSGVARSSTCPLIVTLGRPELIDTAPRSAEHPASVGAGPVLSAMFPPIGYRCARVGYTDPSGRPGAGLDASMGRMSLLQDLGAQIEEAPPRRRRRSGR